MATKDICKSKEDIDRFLACDPAHMPVVEANLRNVAASFVRQLDAWKLQLTPTEIQVADMVRLGKRTKEIARLLHVSPSAIAFHRNNLRIKLGLTGQPINLVSYLRTMAQSPEAMTRKSRRRRRMAAAKATAQLSRL